MKILLVIISIVALLAMLFNFMGGGNYLSTLIIGLAIVLIGIFGFGLYLKNDSQNGGKESEPPIKKSTKNILIITLALGTISFVYIIWGIMNPFK